MYVMRVTMMSYQSSVWSDIISDQSYVWSDIMGGKIHNCLGSCVASYYVVYHTMPQVAG